MNETSNNLTDFTQNKFNKLDTIAKYNPNTKNEYGKNRLKKNKITN